MQDSEEHFGLRNSRGLRRQLFDSSAVHVSFNYAATLQFSTKTNPTSGTTGSLQENWEKIHHHCSPLALAQKDGTEPLKFKDFMSTAKRNDSKNSSAARDLSSDNDQKSPTIHGPLQFPEKATLHLEKSCTNGAICSTEPINKSLTNQRDIFCSGRMESMGFSQSSRKSTQMIPFEKPFGLELLNQSQ